jgi:hypothetical protein
LSWVTFKKVCIPRSFLVLNVCNKGKTLCSPCIITHSRCLIYADYIEIFRAENSFGACTQWQSDIDSIQGWVLLILHSINSILIHPVLLNYIETQTKQTQHVCIIQQYATPSTLLYNTKVLCLTTYFVWISKVIISKIRATTFSSKTNALFSTCKLGDSHTARTDFIKDFIKDLILVTYSKLYFHFISITFFLSP